MFEVGKSYSLKTNPNRVKPRFLCLFNYEKSGQSVLDRHGELYIVHNSRFNEYEEVRAPREVKQWVVLSLDAHNDYKLTMHGISNNPEAAKRHYDSTLKYYETYTASARYIPVEIQEVTFTETLPCTKS